MQSKTRKQVRLHDAINIRLIDAGTVQYEAMWERQREIHAQVLESGQSALVLCEHPPVFSMGSQAKTHNLLRDIKQLHDDGFDVVQTDRGGDVTYHGPGQLVAYPIFHLADFPCGEDLHAYMRALEEVVITALADFDLEGYRVEGKTGAWVQERKIASIGVKCSRWTTMHGLALNVTTNMDHFGMINPCGLNAEDMVSLEQLCTLPPSMKDAKEALLDAFSAEFNTTYSE